MDDQWPRPPRPKPPVVRPLLEAGAWFGLAYALNKGGRPRPERQHHGWAWRAFPIVFILAVILISIVAH